MFGPRHAVLRLVAGAVMISFSPVWVSFTSADPTTSAFYRLAIGGALLLAFVRWRGERIWIRPSLIGAVVIAGTCFAFDLFFWHRSILFVGAGISTLLANFQVFILTAVAFVLYRQRPGAGQLIAIPLALLGLMLIVGIDWSVLTPEYRLGVVFGLLTAVSYAGYILGLQLARVRGGGAGSPMRDVALASLAGAVVLAVLTLFTGESLRIPSVRDAFLLTGYSISATVLGWVLISSSLAHVSTTRVGLILLLQPTLAFAWDVLLLGRGFTAIEALGAAIALVAIYLGSRRDTRAADTPGSLPGPGAPERPPR
ncbi:MAG: DMT family transporter [Gammaproteobacteria bacterium]|nr:MAG: DMT family transporter [Gammaproteobacteria bacterium]